MLPKFTDTERSCKKAALVLVWLEIDDERAWKRSLSEFHDFASAERPARPTPLFQKNL